MNIAATINDIAKAANVAPSTVSRVIANSHLISEKTRERVLAIMKEMDYHPNMIARSLVRQSTHIIGMMIPGTSEKAFQIPFFAEILRGITAKAGQHGYRILLSNIGDSEEEMNSINELVNGRIVEGIILMTSRLNDQSVDELVSMDFPFVIVGRPEAANEEKLNWVDNDNCEAGYMLTRHFIETGHRKIAFIGLSNEHMVMLDRFCGYKKALAEFGLPYNDKLIVQGHFMEDKDNGYAMMQTLMERKEPFSGVIASDDFQAFSAINFLTEHGLSVPGDIAVAGFNNVPQSEYYVPSLTSVEVHPYQLGERSFEILFKCLEDKQSDRIHQFVKVDLIKRRSC